MDHSYTTVEGDRFILRDRVRCVDPLSDRVEEKGTIIGLCAGAAWVSWDKSEPQWIELYNVVKIDG
jgi:hypothetical protein